MREYVTELGIMAFINRKAWISDPEMNWEIFEGGCWCWTRDDFYQTTKRTNLESRIPIIPYLKTPWGQHPCPLTQSYEAKQHRAWRLYSRNPFFCPCDSYWFEQGKSGFNSPRMPSIWKRAYFQSSLNQNIEINIRPRWGQEITIHSTVPYNINPSLNKPAPATKQEQRDHKQAKP